MLRKSGWHLPSLFFGASGGRNRAVFEGVPSTQNMNSFVHTLLSWTSVLSDCQGSDVIEFLSMLGVV